MISLGRLSDRNYGCRQRPRYLIFSQFSIGPILLPKCVCLRGSASESLGPHRGASSASSWQTLGLTIAEGPTELRAPGPRDPTIRHWLCINDLPDTIDSQVRLFADDTVLYRTIKSDTDHHRLQTDLDKLSDWAKAWDMQFHPDKCLVMNISKKRHPSKFTYSLHNTDLKTTDTAKYLGIIISQNMKWTKHITLTCSRANREFGFIKRNVKIRSPRIKEKLYNSLVRPHVEYASAVWSPHEVKPIHQLEMVQRSAARWTPNRHHNTSSVNRMLEDLQWQTLEQRRTDCRLVLLFQIIYGLVQIPPTNYLQPSLNTTSHKNHNYTYEQCSTRTNYFKYSFFPYTTVIWNNLPYQLVNSPSVISFKAQVSKLQHIRE